ncbi:hypothetical protein O181_051793 [Austropuccinia psidii MF-1]|uniref:Uncharacterized protein n=1 Tax=Austropuccinia psidii MF-1 TaxID=1389203 RepID=A0A9Q3HNQ5_9BASI|nr:hypothetical protein [Austropuccinia psidii MF-1]
MARGVPTQNALVRNPLWSTMMIAFPSGNGFQDPKQAGRNDSRKLAWFNLVLICPPPLLGHHLMVTSLLNQRRVIIWPIKDGNDKRTFNLGRIVTMSCHPWDSNAKRPQDIPPMLPSTLLKPSPTCLILSTTYHAYAHVLDP